jgi:hypothetical protein
MSASSPQIAYVLFLDIVGYSRESTTEQARLISSLTEVVQGSSTYQTAKAAEQVIALPTGDGMVLVYLSDVFAPATCAIEISRNLLSVPVRMGIHSGPVQFQTDVGGGRNVVGEGINTSQRVMDFAAAGQILLSEQYAGWLRQFDQWMPLIAPLGNATAKHGQLLKLYTLASSEFGLRTVSEKMANSGAGSAVASVPPQSVVIIYKRNAEPDQQVLEFLESSLAGMGHEVFVDRHLKIGVEWAKAIEQKLSEADVVVAVLSDSAATSEMLEYELDVALKERQTRGKPLVLPVRVGSDKPLEGVIGSYINSLNYSSWFSAQDNARVLAEVVTAIQEPLKPKSDELILEPVGGAVPPDSPFYIERSTDLEFNGALKNLESILLVKAPRQMGKTSLIGRGITLANGLGYRSAVTDFQKLSLSHVASEDQFYKLLAATIAKRIGFKYDFAEEWLDVFGANMNMDNFFRSAIEASDKPMVWFMDEADKLFGMPFASDFFGLVRSWHNSRATEPGGPWSRFVVAIGYATEAHLFIQDLNQSPFNVGRQILLKGFSTSETAELNRRYGSPLKGSEAVVRLEELVSGQPFLIRRALDVLARGALSFDDLMASADRDDGPFGDHLKRILIAVSQMPQVLETLQSSLANPQLKENEALSRLLSAGIVQQAPDNSVRISCELYRRYLANHLRR